MKKSTVLATALTVLLISAGTSFAVEFSDVSKDHWAYKSIEKLAKQEVISGYKDSSFKPDNKVTRAEFAVMLSKALKQDGIEVENATHYSDVYNGYWAAKNIDIVSSLGLVSVLGDRTFKPSAKITKAEALAVVSKALKTKKLSDKKIDKILAKFEDKDALADWAIEPVAQAIKNKVYVGSKSAIEPNSYATRAEIAVLLSKLQKAGKLMAQYD